MGLIVMSECEIPTQDYQTMKEKCVDVRLKFYACESRSVCTRTLQDINSSIIDLWKLCVKWNEFK